MTSSKAAAAAAAAVGRIVWISFLLVELLNDIGVVVENIDESCEAIHGSSAPTANFDDDDDDDDEEGKKLLLLLLMRNNGS